MFSAARITPAHPDVSLFAPRRLLTVADLAALPDELPSGPVRWELDDGVLVAMPPPGDLHCAVELNLASAIKVHIDQHDLGKARCGEVAIVLRRNPDRVVGADVAFIATESLPLRISKEGYLETIPDLVVEVCSKNDTQPQIRKKVRDYLKAGVRAVWICDPAKKLVTEFRRGKKPHAFKNGASVVCADLLPGFAMKVADVFKD